MYSKSKFNLRKFSIALLAMLMAIMLAFTVACKDDNTSDDDDDSSTTTETTTTITDYQSIKNGDFEFSTGDDTAYPYSSSISWSRNLYKDTTSAVGSNGDSGIIDTSDEKFSKLESKNKPSENPKTPYAYGLVTDEYDYEDEDKQSNPQVAGTKILMINNKSKTGNVEGSAQYYKASSSISVPTAQYAVLTFWVKTLDLKSFYTDVPGAHVRLTSSTGSTTYEELVINDINTNGEWAKFEIYIQGSEIANTTLTLMYGLGRGNSVDHNDYVEGFAFLDNVNVKALEKNEYEDGISANVDLTIKDPNTIAPISLKGLSYNDNESETENKYTTYRANLNFNVLTLNDKAYADATTEKIEVLATTGSANVGVNKNVNEVPEAISTAIGASDFSSFTYMNFVDPSSAVYTTKTYSINAESYDLVTFFVKVKADHVNADKLKIEVLNGENDPAILFSSFDTKDLESARYGEWIPYRVFINNPTDETTTYSLKFTFGIDGEWNEAYALQKGYAIIADLNVAETDEDTYKLAATSSYLAKQQVYGKYISYGTAADSTSSDVYPITVDKTQSFSVKKRPATNVNGYAFKSTSNSTKYGIINSNYYDGGKSYGGGATIFTDDITGFESLNTSTNKYAQALVLDNSEAAYSRFVTESKTVSANSSAKVSVKVRAFGNAKANVSIVNAEYNDGDYGVQSFEVNEKSFALTSQVVSTSYTLKGWTYVYFYITAGNEDVNYRVEVSNGMKDDYSVGTILIESVTSASFDTTLISKEKNAFAADFAVLGNDYAFVSELHTRAPSTILTDGEEEDEVVETTKYYQETEVYYGNTFVKFVDYSTIFADEVIDNTTSSDTSEDEDEHDHDDEGYTLTTDLSLQISSMIIAGVLILVILVALIRKGVNKRNKRRQKTSEYYEEKSGFDRTTREKALKKIAERKAQLKHVELSDDETDYDYTLTEVMEDENEEIETVIEEDEIEEVTEETDEELVEEATEEAVEYEATEEAVESEETNKTEE